MTEQTAGGGARFDHVGVNVADLGRAERWYTGAFGLRRVFAFTLDEVSLSGVVLESPRGHRIELLHRAGSAPGPRGDGPVEAAAIEGYGHVALRVDALEPVYDGLRAAGAREVRPPGPSPEEGVRMAWLADPEGNLIELVESRAAGPEAAGRPAGQR